MILLPCPFCGGAPTIRQIGKDTLILKCETCLFTKRQKVLRHSLDWLHGKLTDWWNTRHFPMGSKIHPALLQPSSDLEAALQGGE